MQWGLLALGTLWLATIRPNDAAAQSFACNAARKADETAICQNARLANLDVVTASAFRAKARKAAQADKAKLTTQQAAWLKDREGCASDAQCIEILYLKRLLELDAPLTGPNPKILLGDHVGDATIITLEHPDTENAVALFRRELDDLVEDCNRNAVPGEDDIADAQEVVTCVRQRLQGRTEQLTKRRARCAINTIYTEFGNYTLVDIHVKEQKDGQPLIDTDWKDHRDEKIVGNCSACRTPEIISTFKMLCPTAYKAKFDGASVY
ncbi:MAG: hypothetical protein AB1586_19155 [Pseudomonadota bacterium]